MSAVVSMTGGDCVPNTAVPTRPSCVPLCASDVASAAACSTVTSGFMRAMAAKSATEFGSGGGTKYGTQNRWFRSGNVKSEGATPMIVYGSPSRRTVSPTTSGRPPKRSIQRPCDSTMTFRFPSSSLASVK